MINPFVLKSFVGNQGNRTGKRIDPAHTDANGNKDASNPPIKKKIMQSLLWSMTVTCDDCFPANGAGTRKYV